MAILGRKLFFLISLAVTLLLANAWPANAVTTPTFPSCVNPQGTQKVSYSQGTHGVPGNTNTFTGSDSVYTLSSDTLTQCLCADNVNGVQTNWWKVSSLSQDEVNILISQGWISIPDGSAWGLESAPYLAQNSSFVCGSTGTGGPGDGLSDGRSDGRSDGLGGQILGISTGVLGLASTGNMVFILSVLLTGVASLSLGVLLNLKEKK